MSSLPEDMAKSIRRRKLAAVAVVLCWIVLLAVIGFRISGLALDDMYITYRYAGNLLEGNGLTFNPGERVFGISDPGVAFLLAGGAAISGVAIPALGTILTAAALLLIACAVLWEAACKERFLEAAAGGTLVITSSFLWLGQGSGPLVALGFLALAAVLAERHPFLAGALGGFAFWCRPDALIGCGILGLLMLRQSRRLPVAFAAGVATVCGIGFAAARLYYGRFLPSTLTAKQAFASRHLEEFTGLKGFWGRAVEIFSSVEGAWLLVLVPLAALGSLHLWRHTGLAGRLLLVYGGVLAVLYTAFRIPFSIWYVGPTTALIFTSSCFAAGAAARSSARRFGRTAAAGLVLAALIGIGLPAVKSRTDWLRQDFSADWRRAIYMAAGEWLAANTPPDADVAFDEIGIIGYFSRRPMLDLIGLVSPSSIPFSAAGDQAGAFLAKPTRYVLLHTHDRRGGTRPIVSRPWFERCYRRRTRVHLPRFGVSMIVFERRARAVLPAPRPPNDRRVE